MQADPELHRRIGNGAIDHVQLVRPSSTDMHAIADHIVPLQDIYGEL